MSFSGLLIHTVEVYRRSGRMDRFGQPVDLNPRQSTSESVATYKCRLTRGTGGLTSEERSRDVFETQYRLYTEIGVDIQPDDAVLVKDENGADLIPRSKIKNKSNAAGSRGGHHWEFVVWVQSGASV